MSVEALAVVLHHSQAKGTDKLVLIGIANHAGDGGAWPSVNTLARYANVDERSVRRSLRRLETSGEVSIHVQAGGSSGVPAWKRPNRYEVTLACPATCDRTHQHRVTQLPTSPSSLWIDPLTQTSPPDAGVPTPLTPTSPHPLTPTSPEPSLEPSTQSPSKSPAQLQTARELADAYVDAVEASVEHALEARCSVCSRLEHDCRSRVATSGHEFSPLQPRGGRSDGR